MGLEKGNPKKHELLTYGTSRAVRLADCDYAGSIDVHIVIRALGGQPFRAEPVAAMVIENVEVYCRRLQYRLHGCCLMPDHLHVLLSPRESKVPLANWLRSFKSYTTNRFMKLGGTPPLWQRSAYDHVCRAAETAEQVLRYIVENPVRRGLVDSWEDWAWTKVCIQL